MNHLEKDQVINKEVPTPLSHSSKWQYFIFETVKTH